MTPIAYQWSPGDVEKNLPRLSQLGRVLIRRYRSQTPAMPSLVAVWDRLREMCEAGWVWELESALLAYTVAAPWYSNQKVLSETFVLDLKSTPESSIRVALFMVEQARKQGAACVVASDSSRGQHMAAAYTAAGYSACGDGTYIYKLNRGF